MKLPGNLIELWVAGRLFRGVPSTLVFEQKTFYSVNEATGKKTKHFRPWSMTGICIEVDAENGDLDFLVDVAQCEEGSAVRFLFENDERWGIGKPTSIDPEPMSATAFLNFIGTGMGRLWNDAEWCEHCDRVEAAWGDDEEEEP